MRRQVEIPPLQHRNTSIDHCDIPGVGKWYLLFLVRFTRKVDRVYVLGICRIESSVVTLADDDYGDLGWFCLLYLVYGLAHFPDRRQL